jgi:AcrR family transcriptional regulator
MTTRFLQMPQDNPSRDLVHPRKPQRANGRAKYELLLDAAERLLQETGPAGLTIQQLALEAGVPMPSVYHFFPGPVAVSVGLSERYLAGLSDAIGQPLPDSDAMSWQDIVATLMRRAVAYYTAHPYAQRLILGSDHSAQIRQSDLANNRLLASFVADLIGPKFPHVAPDALLAAIMVGITIGDAVLTLSIHEQGQITPDYGQEAVVAICGYMSARFSPPSAPTD